MNQLVPITNNNENVEAYRASTNAASICKDIVVQTATTIQGRKYVGVEGWQAIAIAHGCAAGSRDVERVEGGVRAIGEVRRMSDGALIATAEGFVGEDEETWFGGTNKWGKVVPKRNDYAIRAMAQTRAISRACRSAFAHVVVMMNAGLATTPAEEVPHGGFNDEPHDPQTGEVLEPTHEPREKVAGITKIKQRLRAMMTAGNAPDITLEQFRELKRANKADLKTIRDANHSWWTGDGEDFEGFGPWMERRTRELTPEEESETYRQLMDALNECDTRPMLIKFTDAHGSAIEMLDGAESRKFELAYQLKESWINEMDKVGA